MQNIQYQKLIKFGITLSIKHRSNSIYTLRMVVLHYGSQNPSFL